MATTREEPATASEAGEGSLVPEELRRELQDLGLSPYEARLLLAMLQLGPATTLDLAKASGVPRTSTYPVLRGLSEKQLAHRLPGDGPAVYACVGREEIFARLDALEQERLRQHRQRSQRVRALLDETIPQQAAAAHPTVRLLSTTAEQQQAYRRLAADTEHEALIAARLRADADGLDAVLADLAGRVETRVLYQADQGGGASPAIAAMHACQDAGAFARTVDQVPLEVAIFDRKAVLATLERPAGGGTPTVALIEHAGVAEALTDGFKYRWGGGAPCACDDH